MKVIDIADRVIGKNCPVFIVGEIGINANGDIDIAKKLIDMALEVGCDAVKFQKRTPEICVPDEYKNVIRETPWGLMSYLDYRKRVEFDKKDYEIIDAYCKSKGMIWFVSPWDVPSVDFIEAFNIPCYKIASACLTDKELLNRVKQTDKPVILSTGMSTMNQIWEAVAILGEDNLIILHCTSTYPAVEKELNLNMIKALDRTFCCPIGYSGHENGVFPTIVAVALGAVMIERHITIDRAMYGSDQAASLEKRGLEIICRESRLVQEYLGDGAKKVYDSEKPLIEKLRRKK